MAPPPPRTPRRRWRDHLLQGEDLNFLLTNRVPRRLLTRAMGWYSRIRSPWLTRWSIAVWRQFTELDLREARESRFDSLQACFTRALKDGARPQDGRPGIFTSPCDALVGACGDVQGTTVFQAKGFPYALGELLGDEAQAERWRDGRYATLRLTSAMYHRFHAPHDGRVTRVRYLSGDTWNVNPIALRRVERLFCRNERAVLDFVAADGTPLLLVPVAAILVASIRLHGLDVARHLRELGAAPRDCDIPCRKGDELGWFEHGSTIIVFAPPGLSAAPGVETGRRLRVGEPLFVSDRDRGAPRTRLEEPAR